MALLMTIMILLLVTGLALASLSDAELASSADGRSRSTQRAVVAADAGIQLALGHLSHNPPDLDSIDQDLYEANVQSRARTELVPQSLTQERVASLAEGYAINVDSAAAHVDRLFRVNVTAESGGSTAELMQ